MAVKSEIREYPWLAARQVIEAYDIALRRWPDPSGLDTYSELLLDGAMTQHDVILDLYRSDEFAAQPARLQGAPDEASHMAPLLPLFDAARSGRLLEECTDPAGKMKIGFLLRSLLNDDMGHSIVLYDRYRLETYHLA